MNNIIFVHRFHATTIFVHRVWWCHLELVKNLMSLSNPDDKALAISCCQQNHQQNHLWDAKCCELLDYYNFLLPSRHKKKNVTMRCERTCATLLAILLASSSHAFSSACQKVGSKTILHESPNDDEDTALPLLCPQVSTSIPELLPSNRIAVIAMGWFWSPNL